MPHDIVRTARAVEGELQQEEWRAGAGWHQAELGPAAGDTRCEVLDGLVRVRIGATVRVYRSGESAIVAPGEVAVLQSVDGEAVHLLVQRWSPVPDRPGG